jgi:small subunit ribosomal protein S15
MSTIYGKGRGKAGSHRPKPEKPYWLKLQSKEIEELIVKLAKQELPSAKIGLVLRDTYGIPSTKAAIGKKIQQVLKENKISVADENTIALEKKHAKLNKHIEKNKQDKVAKRGKQLTESKLARLKRYKASK